MKKNHKIKQKTKTNFTSLSKVVITKKKNGLKFSFLTTLNIHIIHFLQEGLDGIYDQTSTNITIKTIFDERLNAFLLRLGTRKGCLFSPFLFNSVL